ncbi:hypothetical protein Agub_g12135 [Astrephomene gubernaculifera]|uniref:Uncharacterized protein n=1 Tax=Astrephomene gubernaculifera TaxID=47775 RepID=A0AAD3DZR5_9CHLO|nr:hypothetical protein Agub_g12135 [Astrephomene gubernaculifera]
MGNALSLAVSNGVPLVGGMVGGFVTQKDVLTWYAKINKPRWTPPNFLFAPVWSALYVMMGTASWLVWRKKGKNHKVALGLYGAQLLLNLIWNPLFFKTHKTDVALVDITALLGLATAATVFMSRASSPAVQLPLMVPYLVWVSYATALNANIWATNPSERLIKPRKQKAAQAKPQPAGVVREAARAAATGVEAVKAASEAVTAVREGQYGKAILAADQVPTTGSAAVQHAAAAAQPVMKAAGAVKHTTEEVKHVVKDAGAALGVSAPSAPPPPSPSAGSTPASMAPASKAMAKEVERATKAAKAAAKGATATSAPGAAEAGETRGAAAAIEQELKEAGAL